MKHSGKARKAAFKLIAISLIAAVLIWAVVALSTLGLTLVAALTLAATPVLIVVWVLFAIFTLYFFRDPTAKVPAGAKLVLAPGHGKVDGIDMVTEPQFMGGECQRITIFLSVLNVHVQN